MARMSTQHELSSFTIKLVLLFTLLCLPRCALAHTDPAVDTSARNISGASFNRLVSKRANTANDADKDWWPFMGVEMQLPDAKIDFLPNTDLEKKKLRAARKGFGLLCKMKSPVSNPPTRDDFKPSAQRTAQATFQRYGWGSWFHKPVHDLESLGLGTAFDDLSISKTPELWHTSMITHEAESEDAFSNYPATYASYDSAFNLKDGVLIAISNWGPATETQKPGFRHITPDKLVPLRRWSDVVWLHREKIIKDLKQTDSAAPLEHIFRHNVVNPEAEAIFQMVTGKQTPAEAGRWPGLSYPISEPQALATLSSPNGYGPAWLLIQHKELGSRMIDRVNIFDCGMGRQGTRGAWCLYLHITDSE